MYAPKRSILNKDSLENDVVIAILDALADPKANGNIYRSRALLRCI
jgi:hypothetical protein